MTTTNPPRLVTAIATPFGEGGLPDHALFVAHAKALLAEGSDFLAVFGSTGEGPSLTAYEKQHLLEALAKGGVPAANLYIGAGSCSVVEAASLARFAAQIGVASTLLPPPYYYKPVEADGVIAFYSTFVDLVADPRLKLVLYNYPQMTGIDITLDLAGRLCERLPGIVTGYKDSSGKLEDTVRIARALPNLAVYTASEALVIDHMRGGGAGCFSGSANISAAAIRALLDAFVSDSPRLDAQLAHVKALRGAIQAPGLVPAVKALLTHTRADGAWRRLREPLMPLADSVASPLWDHVVMLRTAATEAGLVG